MTRPLQRFDFGTLRDFRGPIQFTPAVMPEVAEEAPPPPPPPSFNEDEMQQARLDARKLGYQEGFMAGMQQAATEADQQAQQAEQALQAIRGQVAALADTYAGVLKQQSHEVSELALMIARKVAAEALDAHSVEVIAALVVRCLPVVYGRPRITIELNPDTLPKAQERLSALLAQDGFEGDMQWRANPALAGADARVEWGNGVAERSTAALWQDIESLLARIPLELSLPHEQPEEK